jgi:hypothetical protein
MAQTSSSTLSPSSPRQAYDSTRLFLYVVGAVALGVLIAGFWNYHLVDGFGKDVIAGATIGETSELAGSYSSRGAVFGFLFAAVAGAAATFTACNCVVFALLPGLACSVEDRKAPVSATAVAGWFTVGVLTVCGLSDWRSDFWGQAAWRCSTATGSASRRPRLCLRASA